MDFKLTEIKDINAVSVKRDNSMTMTMAIMHTKVISIVKVLLFENQ